MQGDVGDLTSYSQLLSEIGSSDRKREVPKVPGEGAFPVEAGIGKSLETTVQCDRAVSPTNQEKWGSVAAR